MGLIGTFDNATAVGFGSLTLAVSELRVALNQASVIKRFDELNIVRMKADWTLKDPVITATLAEFGRNGVPLYVFYPKSGNPVVLPEVLTPSVLIAAVNANSGEQTAHQ